MLDATRSVGALRGKAEDCGRLQGKQEQPNIAREAGAAQHSEAPLHTATPEKEGEEDGWREERTGGQMLCLQLE